MATTLTKDMKAHIIDKALKLAFDDRFAAFKEDRKKLGDELYRSVVTEEQEALMRSLPREFWSWTDRIQAKVGYHYGNRSPFLMTVERPIPQSIAYNGISGDSMHSKLLTKTLTFNAKEEALEKERSDLRRKLLALVESIRTLKQLLVTWPESEALIEKSWLVTEKVYLPVVPIADINAAIFKKAA